MVTSIGINPDARDKLRQALGIDTMVDPAFGSGALTGDTP
jgi:hypothetical protein